MVVFYELNGVELNAPEDDAFDLVVGIASGRIYAAEAALRLGEWRTR